MKKTKKAPTRNKSKARNKNKTESFRGLFGGRQQKGKISLAILTGLLFAAVGTYMLFTSFAATGDKKPEGTYTNWQWDASVPQQLSMLDTFLTIDSDPTLAHPGYGYYWASQFGMIENGGYMGIQTRGEAGTYRGKVAIFALWSATQGVENGSAGSHCTIIDSSFDGGPAADKGSTCRIPLPWKAGDSYRLRLSAVAADSKTRTWQATVRNSQTGQELVIGKIKTTLSYGLLKPWLSNWTEYYSGGRSVCEMPYSNVVFGHPKFNDTYWPLAPQNNKSAGACPSAITGSRSGVRHEQNIGAAAVPVLPGGGTYISDMNWATATTGYGVITKDQSVHNNGTPINLAGRTFAKGIGTHAVSEINYALDGKYSNFVSYVNLQYGASGTVGYQVWADGAKLFESGVMDSLSMTKAINVNVTGKQKLKLVVTDGGNGIGADWAAWADARLISPTANQHPAASITGPAEGIPGSKLTYNAQAKDANSNLTAIEIYFSPRLTNSFTLVKNCSFAAAASASCSGTWTPASAGSYDVVVNAYDALGAKCSGNPNIKYPYYEYVSCGTNSLVTVNVVNAPATTTGSDTTKPAVTISSPANWATIGYWTNVSASATDNVKVVKMEVYVDGQLKHTVASNSISYNWMAYYSAKGQHTITVKAYDAAGNTGQSDITVTKL